MPAMPGSVNVAFSIAITPRIRMRFITTAMNATTPDEVVVDDEEDGDDDQADDAGEQAGAEVVLAELRADGPLADRLIASSSRAASRR